MMNEKEAFPKGSLLTPLIEIKQSYNLSQEALRIITITKIRNQKSELVFFQCQMNKTV
jgi:hypothetical protein